MNCKYTEEYMMDYLDGQLSEEDARQVREHIGSCNACKTLYDETRLLLAAFKNMEEEEPSANLKQGFYDLLDQEKQLLNVKVEKLSSQEAWFSWKRAFQVAASLVLLFSGYFFGSYNSKQHINSQIVALQHETNTLKEGMVLAMIENQSVSKRIQAVNYTETLEKPDLKIVEALIERMQFDGNINVRLAAAEALSEFSESTRVKDAFIKALTTQKDPSLQITIIQFLVKTQEKRAIAPMQELLEQSDIPDFVKAQVNLGISEII